MFGGSEEFLHIYIYDYCTISLFDNHRLFLQGKIVKRFMLSNRHEIGKYFIPSEEVMMT